MTTNNNYCNGECGSNCLPFNCWDCNVNTLHAGEYYMVADGLWETATEDCGADVMLCIGCLEARLGDKLTVEDFTDAPINTGLIFPQSARLQGRLATSN